MYEEVLAFERAFLDEKRWVTAERDRLIGKSKGSDLTDLEEELDAYSAETTRRLLRPGQELMATTAFSESTFEQQMGFTRYKLSGAAAHGYDAVSAVQRAILLQKNREDGIISLPATVLMEAGRVEAGIGLVAERLIAGDLPSASNAYAATQESIIKHAQIEAIMGSQRRGKSHIEAKRIIGGGETCTYCKALAGYWTEDLSTLRHFHANCRCRVITRNS